MTRRIIKKVHYGRVEYNKKPHFSYRLIEWEGKAVEVRQAQDFLAVYTLKRQSYLPRIKINYKYRSISMKEQHARFM